MTLLRRLDVDAAGVLGTIGVSVLVLGLAQLAPVAAALAAGGSPWRLLAGALLTATAGLLLLPLRRQARRSTRREALAVVGVSWVGASAAAAVPFLAAGACGPVDALFEAVSGLTTTGATVFVDVDGMRVDPAGPPLAPGLARALHLWRALLHWIGGAGIVLLVVVLTPFLEDADDLRRTQRVESSLLTERYRGSTKATVRALVVVYVALTTFGVLALLPCGLSLWDAVLHSFAAIATGGFSTRTASLGAWGPSAQLVAAGLMTLGALNFAMLGRAFEDGRLTVARAWRERGARGLARAATIDATVLLCRHTWRHGEVRGYLALLLGAAVFCAGVLLAEGDPARYAGLAGAGRAGLDAVFYVTSIASTTGFCTVDYLTWPPACQVALLLLMVVGGCSGSTAGGIKFRRLAIVSKFVLREARRMAYPRAVFPMRVGGQVVSEDQVREAVGFVAVYGLVTAAVYVVVSVTGAGLATAGGGTVACMGSIGPGFGECGPMGNFQGFTATAKVSLAVAMLLGRLEIYPLVAAALPSFWLGRPRQAL